jgi:hypothetical protein
MPQLRALQEKYPRQMVVLGINAGETPAAGAAGAKRLQLDFPVLLSGDRVMEQYAATAFPAAYLVDPAGRIVEAQLGANVALWSRVETTVAAFQPPAGGEREGTGGPRRATQISHELTFPMPPGPREWVVGREVAIHFKQPEGIPADLVSLSVDGKQIAAFGPASSYTWDATEVSNGSHKLRIAAQTASGRETWAVEQLVIVDNRAPVAQAPARAEPGAASPQRDSTTGRKPAAKKKPVGKRS